MKSRPDQSTVASVFGKQLAVLRQKKDLSLKSLGTAVGLSHSYLSRLENGSRQPSKEVVVKLGQVICSGKKGIDNLLILAGFTPLNMENLPRYESQNQAAIYQQNLEKNKFDFKVYESYVMLLIKTGCYEQAKEKVQEGFQIFDDSVELQSLLAKFELAKGNHLSAIAAQRAAINQYHLKPDKDQSKQVLAHLLFNLGDMHYFKGNAHLRNKMAAESQGEEQTAAQEAQWALEELKTAHDTIQQALERVPEDIYMLDEYARVSFSLALADASQSEHWQSAIATFKQVLSSEKAPLLGHGTCLEASVFLAHAHTKSGQFEAAELVLTLLGTFAPDHGLVHYAKACFYSLKYEKENQAELLEAALKSLEKAVSIEAPDNKARYEALIDPDLKAVRVLKKQEFGKIINRGDV